MKPDEYRQMLVDALAKPVHDAGSPVLTLVGRGGLGARGKVVGYTEHRQPIRLYDKADVAKMLAKFDRFDEAVSDV